jgi:hypothetical protein
MTMVQQDIMTEKNNKTFSNNFKLCIPWGTIIAGMVVSISCVTLLNILGMGIGLVTFDADNFSAIKGGSGAIAWLSIAGILSMGVGGGFVGKFSAIHCKFRRACYGILTWGVTLLFTVIIASSAVGVFMGGVIKLANSPMATIATKAAIQGQVVDKITDSATGDLRGKTGEAKDEAQDSVNSAGKISVLMFIDFFLSAIAGILGAMFATSFKIEEELT